MDDLVTWLRAQLDDDEREWLPTIRGARQNGKTFAMRMLREVDAKRRILDEHQPEWRTVEWPHDQNGKGEAQVCRRCQNAEHSTWNPPVGHAGVLPEGFIVPYVLAPCPTLRLLALPYADRPGYRDEWKPE